MSFFNRCLVSCPFSSVLVLGDNTPKGISHSAVQSIAANDGSLFDESWNSYAAQQMSKSVTIKWCLDHSLDVPLLYEALTLVSRP